MQLVTAEKQHSLRRKINIIRFRQTVPYADNSVGKVVVPNAGFT